jgi:hypothetical protein
MDAAKLDTVIDNVNAGDVFNVRLILKRENFKFILFKQTLTSPIGDEIVVFDYNTMGGGLTGEIKTKGGSNYGYLKMNKLAYSISNRQRRHNNKTVSNRQ